MLEKNKAARGKDLREKTKHNHSKKRTSVKKYIVVVIIAVILTIAVIYVLSTMPPPPKRYVKAQLVIPPGPVYNSTSDELRLWLNLTPSDSNLYFSRMAHPSFPHEIPFHERLDENGTVIQFTISNYSIYWGTPLSGSVIAIDLFFSDVNTNQETAKTELRVKMP